MGQQPRLFFTGLKGPGDEVYDLVGLDGLLGVRPGEKAGEVFAFMDRTATAAAAVKRLTNQAPGPEPLPVRGARAAQPGGPWGAGAAGGGGAWGAAPAAPAAPAGG